VRTWTPDQDALMREHYPHKPMSELISMLGKSASAIYNRANTLGLAKTEQYLASPHASRLRRGDNVGAHCRFKKGNEAWNKGMKGWAAKGTEKTRFKPGSVPPNYRPVGSIRVVEGYQEVKVAEGIRQWKQLHRVVWERCNGPIPKGMCLIFRDGNKLNVSLANLELVTRQQNMKRNSYHQNYPKEIQLAIQLRGALNRQINKRTNHEQH
jgi:hypothetical protein